MNYAMVDLMAKTVKNPFPKALLLGTLITLGTGVWEYHLKFGMFNDWGTFRGLPFPISRISFNSSHRLLPSGLITDILFWSLISLLILFLLRKRKS